MYTLRYTALCDGDIVSVPGLGHLGCRVLVARRLARFGFTGAERVSNGARRHIEEQ